MENFFFSQTSIDSKFQSAVKNKNKKPSQAECSRFLSALTQFHIIFAVGNGRSFCGMAKRCTKTFLSDNFIYEMLFATLLC